MSRRDRWKKQQKKRQQVPDISNSVKAYLKNAYAYHQHWLATHSLSTLKNPRKERYL